MVWANAAPESYFGAATGLRFWITDVGMTLLFGLVAQEVTEAVLPGGALKWRRWLLPILARRIGSRRRGGYLAYVNWRYELALRDGWMAAA